MTARAEHAPKPGKRRAPKRRKAAAKPEAAFAIAADLRARERVVSAPMVRRVWLPMQAAK